MKTKTYIQIFLLFLLIITSLSCGKTEAVAPDNSGDDTTVISKDTVVITNYISVDEGIVLIDPLIHYCIPLTNIGFGDLTTTTYPVSVYKVYGDLLKTIEGKDLTVSFEVSTNVMSKVVPAYQIIVLNKNVKTITLNWKVEYWSQ